MEQIEESNNRMDGSRSVNDEGGRDGNRSIIGIRKGTRKFVDRHDREG